VNTTAVPEYNETVNGRPFCEWDPVAEPQPDCVNITMTSPMLQYNSDTTYISYRIWAKDRAGNMNSSSDTGQWFYITTHALANFLTHNIYLSLGQSYDLGVQVRNTQDTFDTITLRLGGYPGARFLNSTGATIEPGGRLLTIGLNPHEERTLYARIFTTEVSDTPYRLDLTATSTNNFKDTDYANIYVNYPAAFPGLSEWAIAILVILSVAIYIKAGAPRQWRHGGSA